MLGFDCSEGASYEDAISCKDFPDAGNYSDAQLQQQAEMYAKLRSVTASLTTGGGGEKNLFCRGRDMIHAAILQEVHVKLSVP